MSLVFFDPGQMSARLELQSSEAIADGQGGAVVTFQPVAALWARIEPVSQTITDEASQETFTVTHRIWIGWRDGLAAGMRFVKGGRIFVIRGWRDPDETRRYLLCHCEEAGR